MGEQRDPGERDSRGRASTEEHSRSSADTDPIDGSREGTTSCQSPPPGVLERIDDPVYALDAAYRLTYANDAARELFGLEAVATEGGDRVGECDRSSTDRFVDSPFDAAHERALERGRSETVEEFYEPTSSWLEAIVYPSTTGVTVHVRDVSERVGPERTLERQRERLAALDHVHTVVREINTAIVDGSSREELERVTCRTLADSPSYEFAFVAEASATRDTILNRVEAGVEGYVDAIPLSASEDEPAGRGPAGRAIRTQTVQVSTDVCSDPEFEPWHDDAREHGYRSAAAIPIVYDGSLYGILGVTSARVNAFTNEERDVLAQLGETLGHAIAALERRRVLLGESVLEIELVIDDATAVFDGPAMEGQSVLFDRVVRLSDAEFLEYGTTDRETYPSVEELVDCVPHWKDVTALDESGGRVTFELQISSPPMFSVVDAHDGYVDAAALHDGDYTTTLHLPPGTDVRTVLEEIREVYPSVRTLARRQRSFGRASIGRLSERLMEKLTPRQQTALETAYAAGYFEWPRTSSGEDVAETLDVTSATFHEHLRAAQRKLLESVLDETDELEA
ncbi:bacterio-opsin activator domain-containing protein [Natrarchaeobaculum sulfurireducens]|uniref:Signal transduction histidine kinase n=1 Tax=Natrarchaeobaculum sulfurireducens TaxID=2044521 RepID=A0A346PBY9_9EURY|nr:bacterio-opsin activator domain-containing protein [Natrarchaeobaculum sulfurireducens]AXR77034.1 Signal transduction histidine kinase [Natrarchaeobaculum sulfurireducens]